MTSVLNPSLPKSPKVKFLLDQCNPTEITSLRKEIASIDFDFESLSLNSKHSINENKRTTSETSSSGLSSEITQQALTKYTSKKTSQNSKIMISQPIFFEHNQIGKKTFDDDNQLSDFQTLESYESSRTNSFASLPKEFETLKSDVYTPSIYKNNIFIEHKRERQRSYRKAKQTVLEAKWILNILVKARADKTNIQRSDSEVSGYSSSSSINSDKFAPTMDFHSHSSTIEDKYKVIAEKTLTRTQSIPVKSSNLYSTSLPTSIPSSKDEQDKLIVKLKVYLSKYWSNDGELISWD